MSLKEAIIKAIGNKQMTREQILDGLSSQATASAHLIL